MLIYRILWSKPPALLLYCFKRETACCSSYKIAETRDCFGRYDAASSLYRVCITTVVLPFCNCNSYCIPTYEKSSWTYILVYRL